MGLRDVLFTQALRLARHPRAVALALDPRVMDLALRALALQTRAKLSRDEAVRRVLHGLHLATLDEVRALQRAVRRMEERINTLEAERDARPPDAAWGGPHEDPWE